MKVILALAFLGLVAVVSAKEYKCPDPSEEQDDVFLPNVDDCSTYFICINGHEILTSCQTGYHFDVNTLTCRPKNEAECATGENKPVEPSTTEPSPAEPSTTEPSPAEPSTAEPEVPCVRCPPQTSIDEDILLPNIRNCSTYYHCSHGFAYLQACPPNLHFNNKMKYCDYPANAKCVESETC